MSKQDFVSGKTLLNPHVEIGKYFERNTDNYIQVNVSTFEECLSHLRPPFIDNEPTRPLDNEQLFAVFGVVGRTVKGPGGSWAYLNIDEQPISRTLMGYLPENSLKEKLPKIWDDLTKKLD